MTTRGSENRDFAAYNFGGVSSSVPTAAASLSLGAGMIIRRQFAVGGAADIPVLAVGLLPFRFRVVSLWGIIQTSPGGSTIAVWTGPGGTLTRLGIISSAATGFPPSTATATATTEATPNPAIPQGLYFLRSNAATAGEIILLIQKTY